MRTPGGPAWRARSRCRSRPNPTDPAHPQMGECGRHGPPGSPRSPELALLAQGPPRRGQPRVSEHPEQEAGVPGLVPHPAGHPATGTPQLVFATLLGDDHFGGIATVQILRSRILRDSIELSDESVIRPPEIDSADPAFVVRELDLQLRRREPQVMDSHSAERF